MSEITVKEKEVCERSPEVSEYSSQKKWQETYDKSQSGETIVGEEDLYIFGGRRKYWSEIRVEEVYRKGQGPASRKREETWR